MRYRAGAMRRLGPLLLAVLAGALLAAGCNRNIEEYDPEERPEQPDLSKIFPSGAEVALANEGPAAGMLPEAGGRRGAPPVAAASEAGAPIRGSIAVAPALEGRVPELHAVGDCTGLGLVQKALLEGARAACAI